MDFVPILRPLVPLLVSELAQRKLFEDTLNDISSMLLKHVASSRSGYHTDAWREHGWASNKYNYIFRDLEEGMKKYRRFIAKPSSAELAEFRNVGRLYHLRPEEVFRLCRNMVSPGGVIVELTVDNEDISERRKEFGVRTICDACCLRMALVLTDVHGASPSLSTNSAKTSSHMAQEVEQIRAVLSKLKLELDKSSVKGKSYFLIGSSESGGDNDCTTGKEQATPQSCSLKSCESEGDNDCIRGKEQATSKYCFLAEQLHGQLRHQLDSRATVEGGNPRLCIDISNFLRKTYKDYSWDVVVLESHKNMQFLVAPKHTNDIWYQRAGSSQRRALDPTETENTILLRGKQSQGCFVFYRYTPDSKTTIVVFWVDPKLMPNGRLKVARSIDRSLYRANVFEVTSYLQDQPMDYLFAVGIDEHNGKVFGVQLTKEADLFEIDRNRTVLVCLPMPRPDDAVSESIVLPKGPMTLVAQDAVSQYRVFKYQQLLDGISTTLAVKAIPVANVSAQQVTNQVSVLDVNLGFLLRFDDWNLVRYLSLQFDDSTVFLGRRTYNIVMEFCEGTQLTKLVRNVLPMSTVVNYGEQILSGLEYLHDNNVSHRAVYGDHIMVTGFGAKSVGRVRLISIARIRELCPRENQSFNPNHSDKILPLFMPPPETDGRVGSKTDIWSFGCVMIQIITGDWPVWKSSETVKRVMPQIPDQIPPVLNEVIQQCLQLEYDKRPKAGDLLRQLLKSHGEVKELFTPPRQPIDNRKQGSASFFKEF